MQSSNLRLPILSHYELLRTLCRTIFWARHFFFGQVVFIISNVVWSIVFNLFRRFVGSTYQILWPIIWIKTFSELPILKQCVCFVVKFESAFERNTLENVDVCVCLTVIGCLIYDQRHHLPSFLPLISANHHFCLLYLLVEFCNIIKIGNCCYILAAGKAQRNLDASMSN